MNVENRTLFIADNLDILRGIDSETIDLIYLDPPEPPGQMVFEGLFPDPVDYSEPELQAFRSKKHLLFGNQEGKCNGCQMLFHYRNITIDHTVPQSKGGSDDLSNLQLLCGACNSTKRDRTQQYLINKLREDKIIS